MNITKGTWKVVDLRRVQGYAIETRDKPICEVPDYIGNTSGETESNAHLIASAPDMYEALKEIKLVWQELDPDIKFPHLQEVINKALAKAEEMK